MPTTVNGIGTYYYGKNNRTAVQGVCENCKTHTELTSYETRLWFVVVFIPIIPLGRKQIIDMCPVCNRHRVLPKHKFEELQQEALEASAREFTARPDDVEAAIEMHATLVNFQKPEEARRLAEILVKKFPDHAPLHFYLGGWNERLGQDEPANKAFARAFELAPDEPAYRRAVALIALETGDPDRARELLAGTEPPSPRFEANVWRGLAAAYMQAGQPAEAFDILQMVLQASPALSQDKAFRKQFLAAENEAGVTESQLPPIRGRRTRIAVLAGAAVVALVGFTFGMSYLANHRTLHVVNGLPQPITVAIDDRPPLTVGPNQKTDLTLPEGDHRAVVQQPPGDWPPVEFRMHTPWLTRWFRKPAFVLDPTRSAALVWEQATYREVPQPEDKQQGKLSLGEPFVEYNHIDYLFGEFPQQINLERGSAVVKTRLARLPLEPVRALAVASEIDKTIDVLPYAEAHLRARPENPLLVQVYGALAMRRQAVPHCLAVLASRLDQRPVLVHWHRIYQDLSRLDASPPDLFPRYDSYLKSDPDNASLLYLRGRLEPHRETAFPWYERAIAADGSNPFPWMARALYFLGAGEFPQAKQACMEACRLKPDDLQYAECFREIRIAMREYAALEAELRGQLANPRGEPQLAVYRHLMELYFLQGNQHGVRLLQRNFFRQFQDARTASQESLLLNLEVMSLQGNFQQMLERARTSSLPPARTARYVYQARVELGQMDALPTFDSQDDTIPLQPGYLQLCTALGWLQQGNADRAAAARQQALDVLAQGNLQDRQTAELLRKSPQIEWTAVESLLLDPQQKALVVTALAESCPDQRENLLTLAGKLNYHLVFPHHLINRRIAALRK